jgi:DNA-binding response OmpR family regulator
MSKIMVVDDEQDLREMISLMMEKEGYEIEEAKDGSDFLNKIDEFQPDLVTLDVMMPGLTTKDILEQLKEKQTNPKIILLSVVQFLEAEKNKIFAMGNIVDYITKPFDLSEFIETVKKHISKKPVKFVEMHESKIC